MLIAPAKVSDHLERRAEADTGLEVVAATDSVHHVWNLAARTKPDIAVIDADLGGTLAGVAVGRHLQRFLPAIGVVLIAGDFTLAAARPFALEFGRSWTYVHRRRLTDAGSLLNALNSTARGMPWLDPELRDRLRSVWEIALRQRDLEDGLRSDDGQRRVPDAGLVSARGYEGVQPRSFDDRTRERYDF